MIKKHRLQEYQFKFYLNMKHYIMINGRKGQLHPHTWEFSFRVLKKDDDFKQFHDFEYSIEQYLEQYQGSILNEKEPFDTLNPTLENVTDYFSEQIRSIIQENGSELVYIESRERPTRSYIINYERESELVSRIESSTKSKIDEIIDMVLNGILHE